MMTNTGDDGEGEKSGNDGDGEKSVVVMDE